MSDDLRARPGVVTVHVASADFVHAPYISRLRVAPPTRGVRVTPADLFAENGPIEVVQLLTLAVGAVAFSLSAFWLRTPGGPFLILGAVAMGVAGLREFDVESGSTILAYLGTSSPRIKLAAIGFAVAAWLALRRPFVSLRRHLDAVAPLAAPLGVAVMMVIVGDSMENLRTALLPTLALEELLELGGYMLATTVAVRTAFRIVGAPAALEAFETPRLDPPEGPAAHAPPP